MADCLKLPGRHDSKANIFKLVHDWLRHEGKIEWLLILDNVDDARFLVDVQSNSQNQTHESKPLREYLPQCPNGSVLITSRNAEAALTLVEQKDIIDVKPMDRDDALALLQKKLVALSTSQGDFEDATELVTVLEFMPLAIVQAAAYISQRAPRCSVRRYLEEFEKNDRKKSGLLNHEAGQLRRDREAKNSIIITWQMSFDHIHQTRPSAADLLSLMSFFDRQGIPETLLRSEPKLDKMDKRESGDAGGGAHDEDSSSQSSDGDEFEDDIMTLRNYSFISLNADGLAFKMHRLVQISMQKWLESTCQLERFRERFVKNLDAIFPVVTYETWDQCQTLYPHTKLALLQQPEDRPSLLNWASMLCKAAYYAQERGNWEDAEIMSLKTMKVLKEQLGEEDQHTLHTTWLVGLTYYHIGRWNEAEEVLARGLQICSRVLGEEHHLTLAVKAELARTYRDLGQWVKAESLQLQILEAYSQALGEKHPYTLSGMSNLASTYWFQGRWKEAEVLQLRVLETSSIILGERHPNTLFCMSDLATTYMELLQWEKAEVLLLQVLERSREVLGDEHPRTITNIQNLALTYAHRGKSREAEELQAQQLDTWSRVMGELHPNTLRVMRNVATAKWENGQQMEGLKSLQECSRLMRQVLGDNHFETINILARLARWEEHLGV
jgi:tetratricopeptide (TPR) repeat protein